MRLPVRVEPPTHPSLPRAWSATLCAGIGLFGAATACAVDKRQQLFHKQGTGSTEVRHTMRARIYKPAKTAMSSGTANTSHWVLEFAPEVPREVDPLMGWTSSSDMNSQITLRFDTLEAAQDYAKAKGIEAVVLKPKTRKLNVRKGGYGDNFATDRRGAWTH